MSLFLGSGRGVYTLRMFYRALCFLQITTGKTAKVTLGGFPDNSVDGEDHVENHSVFFVFLVA